MPISRSAIESGLQNIERVSSSPLPGLVNPVTGTTIGVAYNQQNIGQTIRPPATALLTISSEDRFKNYTEKNNSVPGSYNYSPYDFTITKNESIMNGFFTRLGVSEVVFPTGAIPNIGPTTNKIEIQYNSSITTLSSIIQLNEGFYTPSTLVGEIQANVRGTSDLLSSFTMFYGRDETYETPLPVITYATNHSTDTDITDISFNPLPYNSSLYPYNDNTRQLFNLLGFGKFNTIPYANGWSGVTYCQGTRYVDIVCPQLSYNQSLKDTSSQSIVRDSLCRLYLVPDSYNDYVLPNNPSYAPPGTVPQLIYRNFNSPKQINWTPNQPVGQLTFQVYDDCGNLIKPYDNGGGVQNNADWQMTLQVTEN